MCLQMCNEGHELNKTFHSLLKFVKLWIILVIINTHNFTKALMAYELKCITKCAL